MSSWARAWAYEQSVGHEVNGKWRKNPGAKSVLAAICEFPDQDGRCYVGQKTLATMTDMGERTVRSHLDFLENTANLIRREERRRKDGTRTSDYIWVLAPAERLRPPAPEKHQPAKSAASPASTGQICRDNRRDLHDQPAKSAGPYIDDPSVKEEPLEDPLGVEDNVTPLDSVTREALATLKETKNWKKPDRDTLALLANLKRDFPGVDMLAQCRDLQFNAHYGEKPIKNLTTTLRNYFRQAAKDAAPTHVRHQGASPDAPAQKQASPECVIQALEHYNRDGITDLQKFAPLARQWDFSSEEEIPWEILRQISPDLEERGRYIERIKSIARRAMREAG